VPTETETIEARFRGFAEFSPSPLYRRLSGGVASEPEVIELMLEAAPDQRWPMLLLAAVHLETRRRGEPYPADPGALLDYCRVRREWLLETIRSRSTQTNEVARCNYLLPCLAAAADGRPLALIEVGASRGLLLNLDRYAYDFSGRPAGQPDSPLTLSCDVRADPPPLTLPPIVSRGGVDLAPCTDDEWLRACAFADQPERLGRLEAALEIARAHPPPVVEGDALELLPGLLESAPSGAQVVVFHTAVSAYLPDGAAEELRAAAAGVTHVSAEPTGEYALFALEIDGERVGTAHPHGRWLDWTGGERVTVTVRR
jgi:hypothetical protein